MLSLNPFIIWASTSSWSTTRNIFPAKSVICNFGAALTWATYMNIQMYLSHGYAGIDAVIINCLTMAFNATVLLLYFQNAKEYLKVGNCWKFYCAFKNLCSIMWFINSYHIFYDQFSIYLITSLGCAASFTGVLVFHPYSMGLSFRAMERLNCASNVCAIYGIGFFGILNIMPFHDLVSDAC